MARQRLDVKQAAQVLGVSTDAVHKRVRRGSLESEKDEDGRVFVWLDTEETGLDDGYPPRGHEAHVASLEDQIDYLHRQLEVWQEEARRKDHIIAALTERIPELESASSPEASESPTEASDEPGKGVMM